MDPELTHGLVALATLLLGGGGAYGVQRIRNANSNGHQPQDTGATIPPGTVTAQTLGTLREQFVPREVFEAHHDDITAGFDRGGKKMDTLSDNVTALTISVNKAISDSENKAVKAARDESRAEVQNHEDRWHPKG